MKNVTSTIDKQNKIITDVEEGFDEALVVTVNHSWSGSYTIIHKSAVSSEDLKSAYEIYSKGIAVTSEDVSWTLHRSWYWLVKRDNGSMYPFPLLFASQEQREESTRKYNDDTWMQFYKGYYDSEQLSLELVDTPTDAEINDILIQLDQLTDHDVSQWEDLDQRGGLVPRWAA